MADSSTTTPAAQTSDPSSWLSGLSALVNSGIAAYKAVDASGTPVNTQTPTASASLSAAGLTSTQKIMLGAAGLLTVVLVLILALKKR
jgi:hypothetical protein